VNRFVASLSLAALSLAVVAPSFALPARPASSIEVGVDPRVELLAIVESLSGYDGRTHLMTRYDVAYKREVAEAFRGFREHEAVKLFDAMSQRGFAFDTPVAWILHFGPPPALEPKADVEEDLLRRGASREDLARLADALRDFSKKADVTGFLAKHAAEFDSLAAEVKKEMAGVDVAMLERYFGEARAGYHVVLAPLLHHGGFGPRVRTRDGGWEIYSVGGPHGAKDGRPTFGTADDFRYLVWHEFSHSFVNPIVEANGEAVDACGAAFEPLRAAMMQQAYGTWLNCVQEHVVRACTVRFAFREQGEKAGAKALADELSRRFDHVEALAKKLETYEKQRDRYPTLASFFPELVLVLRAAADEATADSKAAAESGPARRAPRVVATLPRAGDDAVDPGVSEVFVQFDQDMSRESYSWVQSGAGDFPEKTGSPRFVTARTCMLPVKLQPGRSYWIGINHGRFVSFVSTSGAQAETFVLEFKTKSRD